MNVEINNTYIAEIASKFFDKSYDENDIENGIVTEEMIRLAILCDFGVIHRCDYEDVIKNFVNKDLVNKGEVKHKTLWTFLLWVVTLCIFELPLLSFPIGELIGTSNIAYIVIIDIYSVASLFALVIAKHGVKTIDTLIKDLKRWKDER